MKKATWFKRLMALSLCLIMVLSMVACGAKTEEAPVQEPEVTDEPAKEPEQEEDCSR